MRLLLLALLGSSTLSLSLALPSTPASTSLQPDEQPNPHSPSFALQPDALRLPTFDASASSTKVPVTLGVMSKCPDAQVCEILFDRVLDQVGSMVDISLTYIGSIDKEDKYGVHCMHGESECLGNIQQLCVAKYWQGPSGEVNPWADWWNFVQCVNYGPTSRIGSEDLAKSCAKVVKHEWNHQIEHCVSSDEGAELLQESVKKAKAMSLVKSCTVVIGGKAVCIHDGTWKQCPEGHEVGDFTRQIKAEYKRLNQVDYNSEADADEEE
ncbi:hypothetical protein BCR35DRAFT_311490 [Leucosporidium creatinivorum]|uniref:Gamma interferon inducible lysosomal thiol reductase-domain-containing protein n=1 Tax=Leucosporidium creatinivorum TaxID=106004 RepID=A0A1Y2BWT0_9BASI|nr:hypothetical protein BCR35DRAFT_311490 [Leucosporidium creatinivorum]